MDKIIERKIRKTFEKSNLKNVDSSLGFYGKYSHSLKYGDFYLVNVLYSIKNNSRRRYSIDYIVKEEGIDLKVYVDPKHFEILKAITVIGNGKLKKFIKQQNTDLILDKELTEKINKLKFSELDMEI